jgi:tyrosine-specific transport protein
MKEIGKMIGGILLVSGTAIGAGMLMLPVSTGMAGFIPSVTILCVVWFYMTYTAFLLLEASLWIKEESSLISIAHSTLGKWGEIFSWIISLFLLYALTTAYIAGSGAIFIDIVQSITGFRPSIYVAPLCILLALAIFLYRGTAAIDHVNRFLMIALAITYAAIVILLTPHVKSELLQQMHWPSLLFGISVVVTSFGYHIIIPSLVTYLDRDIKKLKWVIFIGSTIPLMTYIYWEYLALGIVPLQGDHSLISGHMNGWDGASLLKLVLGNSSLSTITQAFAFFAILTSFLGVSLSLYDFLADGLKVKKEGWKKEGLYALTVGPPTLIALIDPRAFLSSLEYAGAFGVIILLALMPAMIVWKGRYHHGYTSSFKAPGGKIALIAVIAFSLFAILVECANKLGLLMLKEAYV